MSKFTDWVKDLPLATGSRVIGGATEDSDYDYVCTAEEFKKKFPKYVSNLEEYVAGDDSFLAIKENDEEGRIINLIIVKDRQVLNAWAFTTSFLSYNPFALIRKLILEKPKVRKLLFEAVKTTMIKLIKEGEISIWENSNS